MQPSEYFKDLIKRFAPPLEFKVGPCFWLWWGRGCSYAMEKKKKRGKETVFPVRGAFGKTAALPTAANLQRVLKERSPLFSLNPSMPLNELLPLIPRNGSPASQAAVWVVLMSMGNVP